MASRFSLFGISLEGGRKFNAIIRRMSRQVRTGVVREAARAGGTILLADIKSRAPVRDTSGVSRSRGKQFHRPGFLKRSIGMKIRAKPSTATAKIGPSKQAFYGLFVEYGTKFADAHPFMRPAFDSKKFVAANKTIAVFQKFLAKFNRRFPPT